jgi:hypothetical protein
LSAEKVKMVLPVLTSSAVTVNVSAWNSSDNQPVRSPLGSRFCDDT